MKIFRKIIISFLIIGGILVAVAAILGRIYEDEITQYVVSGLNKQIRTKAEVGDVKLSFFKKFPDASLELKDVVLLSVQNTDTLLQAERLYLRFNVARLLKRQYLIKEVHVHSGMLNLIVDQNGNKNYVFWNRQEDNDSEDFLLDIDNLKLTSINLNFQNLATDMAIAGNVKKGRFKGNFSREEYSLTAGIEGILYHYTKKDARYFKDQKISSSASLSVNPLTIEILSGDLNLGGQLLDVRGKIIRPRPLEYDLTLTSRHLDLDKVFRFNLLKGMKIPGDLEAGGVATFQASVTGMASKTQMPKINASFSLIDGWMKASVIPYGIRELRAEVQYSNGNRQGPESTMILLNNTSLLYGNSRLGGNYEIVNLSHPRINYNIKAELDLADIPS
ncbi:MAG: AsmA family protein, partial [Bacteroidales bacterium]|nr:AsmA family protein [Bacteroidales bacterium]